jgi:hypothetical protein
MKFLIEDTHLDIAERVEVILSYLLQFLLFMAAVVYFFYEEDWSTALLILGILILTFIPAIIRRSGRVHLPVEFDLIIILFVFFSLYLGELQGYYTLYWWWDIVLHTGSGLLFGIAGFLMIFLLNEEKKINLNLKPLFLAVFAFVFAIALGAIWEIFEFSMDQLLGFQMQPSLWDTMWDLIVDSLGAGIISVLGYFYMKKGDFFVFDRMVHKFVDRNPNLFRRKKKR